MMFYLPTGVDLRSPIEKRAHISSMRKRLQAFAYMKANKVVQFLVNGGLS